MNRSTSKKSTRRDIRLKVFALFVLLVVASSALVNWLSNSARSLPHSQDEQQASGNSLTNDALPLNHRYQRTTNDASALASEPQEEPVWKNDEPWVDPATDPQAHQQQAKKLEADQRFNQALAMLHAKRYPEAIVALERMQELLPDNPDVFVNIGYALLGLEQYQAAFIHFDKAMDLNPAQANAYYGAAMAMEGMGDLEGALGGMRSYLHLSQDKPMSNLYVARARSAIWEWESRLGRGPWGPTKGIPPGFTAQELKRDGKGVAVKMPLPETMDEDGMMQYEIRSADKIEIFDR
jgi:tetratricopeptide (TPR) repeat protein